MSIHVDKRLNRHWKLFIDKWSVLFLLAVVAHHGLYSWGTAAVSLRPPAWPLAAVAAWLVLRSNETLALRVGDVLVNLVLAALVVVMADSGQPEGLHRGPALLESLLLWMPAAVLVLVPDAVQPADRAHLPGRGRIRPPSSARAFLVTGSAHAQGFGYSFSRSVIASALIMLLVLSSFCGSISPWPPGESPKRANTVSSPRDQLTDLFTRGVFEEQLQKNAQASLALGRDLFPGHHRHRQVQAIQCGVWPPGRGSSPVRHIADHIRPHPQGGPWPAAGEGRCSRSFCP